MPDLFEIIPRQTVLLCARKGSNKYKKSPFPDLLKHCSLYILKKNINYLIWSKILFSEIPTLAYYHGQLRQFLKDFVIFLSIPSWYGLWVMGTTSAYAREGTVEIVHWPLPPVRFGTCVTPSGKVVPMKNRLHSCKYSAAAGLKDIVLPEVQLSCQVRKALDVLHLQLNVLPVF